MNIPLLSVNWKGHSNGLATECKNLLADNFLVDCTLAAEGQRLAAHRLILSASSPYFRMLFNEGGEKHPIVFLKDVPFEMLKAVVDFVYHGETQIPKGNLEVFLALAKSLQITGLLDSSVKNRIEIVSCSAEGCENSSEVQRTSANREDSSENTSQKLHICPSVSNTMAAQAPFLALREECLDSDVTVKHEPVYSEDLELNDEHVDNVEMEEQTHGKFINEMGEVTSFAFSEDDLSQYRSYEETCPANCAEETAPLLPVIVLVKSEQMDDAEKDDLMQDILQNNANEKYQETRPVGGGKINQCSSAATGREAARGRGRGRTAGQRAQERLPPLRCNLCPAAFNSRSGLSYHKRKHAGLRLNLCDVCGMAFVTPSSLTIHKRTHTGERPFPCDVCGAAFNTSPDLRVHKRTHTGERPYPCGVCGAAFNTAADLNVHRRRHTGERPFSCDVCGQSFAQLGGLKSHRRLHTGERPYACVMCSAAFRSSSSLATHRRTHSARASGLAAARKPANPKPI